MLDSSAGSDDMSFSLGDIAELQQQIISQSTAIEEYITAHRSQTQGSESFAVLQSLFGLFKSEVSMNIALRKAIGEERRLRAAVENHRSKFFKELGRTARTTFDSYDSVRDFVASRESRVSELENDNAARDEQRVKLETSLKRCRSKLNSTASENEALRVELEESNQMIEKQQTAMQVQKQTMVELQAAAEQSQDMIEKCQRKLDRQLQIRSELEAQIAQEREDFEQQCDAFERDLRAANEARQLIESKIVRECRESSPHHKAREEELRERVVIISRHERDILESKQQNEALEKQVAELMNAVAVRDEKLQSETRKADYLKAQLQELEAANAQLLQIQDSLKAKIGDLLGRLDSYKEKRERLVSRLKEMKCHHKREIESLSLQIESQLSSKLDAIERSDRMKEGQLASLKQDLDGCGQDRARLAQRLGAEERKRKQLSKVADELKVENERLRNLMRDKSDGAKGHDPVVAEFRRLREILQLDPGESPASVVDAVRCLICRRRYR
jgi:chromosome segregation ATPase